MNAGVELTVETRAFQIDLHDKGLPEAQRRAKGRQVYKEMYKYRPVACRACTSTIFCSVCHNGGWLS